MNLELKYLLVFLAITGLYTLTCAWINQIIAANFWLYRMITTAIKRYSSVTIPRLDPEQAMRDINAKIDAAENYAELSQVNTWITNFRDMFRHKMRRDELEDYIMRINKEKDIRVMDLVARENMKMFRTQPRVL